MTDPTPTPAAHDWRQLCRACNCPTAPIVPPELIRALELAEAALTDIGETLPGSGALRPRISRALLTWREHATPPAPTREAAPVPPQGLTDVQLLELAAAANGYEMCGVFAVDRANHYEFDGSRLIVAIRAAIAAHEAARAQLPPNYVDPEHTGENRKLLEVFYLACEAEGGTADEIILRGLRAAIAADRAANTPSPSHETR